MPRSFRSTSLLAALLASLLLAACGGSDSGSSGPQTTALPPDTQQPGAPAATGNTATDGFNWFNYRRQQLGLQTLQRNALIDKAAQGHSEYQKLNQTITHVQDSSKPGFTGTTLLDRLAAAGYSFNRGAYAYGEVLSSTTDPSGFNAAEALIAAIYHRFLIFEPVFAEGGAGAATNPGAFTYFTADFTANGLDYSKALPTGGFVTYPFANQTGIPVNFFSDYEVPDPVPDRNEVGYPISVHANINANIVVNSFTVRAHGAGSDLQTVTVDSDNAGSGGPSAVAIIPLDPLKSGTTYDVQFSGTISGKQASRAWSFTTR